MSHRLTDGDADALNKSSPVAMNQQVGTKIKTALENRWEDLRFPATAINPPGAASDPDYDTAIGGWLFDAALTETLNMIAQLPHAWEEGTEIRPHVHWQKTTSAVGNVYWQLEYRWAETEKVMDAAWTTLFNTLPKFSDGDTANQHALTEFTAIQAAGKAISDILIFKLSRVGGEGTDTYGADARLLEFDLHYLLDDKGSEEEFYKALG